MEAVDAGQQTTGTVDHRPVLEDWVHHLQFGNLSRSSVTHYRLNVGYLLQRYRSLPLGAFTAEHLERHLAQRPVSARTRALELKHIRLFFAWAFDRGRVPSNPAAHIKPPRWAPRRMPAPKFPEIVRLLNACQTDEEALVARLYFHTTMRLAEGVALRVGDVDLEERTIRVVGKGDKERIVVFDPAALPEAFKLGPVLARHLAGRSRDDPLLRHVSRRTGRVWKRSTHWVNALLRRLGQRAGLPYKVTVHTLRHAWVRWAKTSGLPLAMAGLQLGHTDPRTTATWYGHVDAADLRDSLDRLLKVPKETP